MTRLKAESTNGHTDIAIIARVLGKEHGTLSLPMARHILACEFSEIDKTRMHDLAMRNQDDDLTEREKHELKAYAKAGTLLSILKSRARQVVRKNGLKHTSR